MLKNPSNESVEMQTVNSKFEILIFLRGIQIQNIMSNWVKKS